MLNSETISQNSKHTHETKLKKIYFVFIIEVIITKTNRKQQELAKGVWEFIHCSTMEKSTNEVTAVSNNFISEYTPKTLKTKIRRHACTLNNCNSINDKWLKGANNSRIY